MKSPTVDEPDEISASLAYAAIRGARLDEVAPELRERLLLLADDVLAWVAGRNPFDSCMLQGRGRNNPDYSAVYQNSPGGIANGITSGFHDEDGIAHPLHQTGLPLERRPDQLDEAGDDAGRVEVAVRLGECGVADQIGNQEGRLDCRRRVHRPFVQTHTRLRLCHRRRVVRLT